MQLFGQPLCLLVSFRNKLCLSQEMRPTPLKLQD